MDQGEEQLKVRTLNRLQEVEASGPKEEGTHVRHLHRRMKNGSEKNFFQVLQDYDESFDMPG